VSARPVHVEARPGDVRDSLADISKAKAILGYEPIVELEEGLRRTVDWYRTQA
jgi:nucleoside-diphosphate-sugar epimerase